MRSHYFKNVTLTIYLSAQHFHMILRSLLTFGSQFTELQVTVDPKLRTALGAKNAYVYVNKIQGFIQSDPKKCLNDEELGNTTNAK